ncbi:MAG: hypothetical protein ABI445_07520 [Polyangia bacterium]
MTTHTLLFCFIALDRSCGDMQCGDHEVCFSDCRSIPRVDGGAPMQLQAACRTTAALGCKSGDKPCTCDALCTEAVGCSVGSLRRIAPTRPIDVECLCAPL